MLASAQPPSMIRKYYVMPTDCLWEVLKKNTIDIKKNPF